LKEFLVFIKVYCDDTAYNCYLDCFHRLHNYNIYEYQSDFINFVANIKSKKESEKIIVNHIKKCPNDKKLEVLAAVNAFRGSVMFKYLDGSLLGQCLIEVISNNLDCNNSICLHRVISRSPQSIFNENLKLIGKNLNTTNCKSVSVIYDYIVELKEFSYLNILDGNKINKYLLSISIDKLNHLTFYIKSGQLYDLNEAVASEKNKIIKKYDELCKEIMNIGDFYYLQK